MWKKILKGLVIMDTKKDKRKKDKENDYEDRRKEKKSRRQRSRSRSADDHRENWRKRKHSRSRSPKVPPKQEKRVENEAKDDAVKKEAPVRKAKETDMLNTRTGGAYIPPARLRMMQAQITDKSSMAYQRLAWEALKKSIHGHINKINVGNIGIIIKELLKENIVRGRGLLCRSVIQAQAASPTFTNVYAALVAAVNSRFPNIGELLLKRLVIQFKRGFKRNDKPTCISSASFIAHLVNQRVAHEILALELLTLLVESPTDDSVEVAIAFLKECGQKLTEVSSKGVNAIFEMLRNILHEGQLDKRVQYMIEVMFQVWKDGFKDHPALIEELELVPEEEQFTHLLMLDDATDPQDILNVFKFDEKYEDNEQKYKTLSKEILGSDAESGEEDGSDGSGSEESDDEEEQEGEQKGMTIIDNTETNLVALRRTIYLTINSSLDFEECAHKLMKMQLKPGQEVELCHMFLDCCAEQRTYEKFYGLLAQRFCNINRMYIGPFEEIFKDSYATAHRLDTNRLRNVSKFFAHLLFTDSISWEVMECVKLNEEDTTSSSRIYIKILFQELAEYMGLKKLNDRLKDPTLQTAFSGIFPRDNPKNTRFSINFFTSIGLGGLTDELREHLKQMPKNVPAPVTDINVESDSSSDSSSSSSSSDSSSDSSSSDSEDEGNKKKKSKKSKDKDKSKQSPSQDEQSSNKGKNDIDKDRWGHDGFYNTYGDNAKRHDNRQERSEQGRDNFAKPRDVSRRYDEREKQNANERGNRNDRYRDGNRRRQDRATGGEQLRENRKETEDRSGRERERRSDIAADRRNERNSGDDNRYDKERSRNRNDREDRRRTGDDESRGRDEERKQDKNQRRDRAEDSFNKSEKNNDKSRDRNSEREKIDKGKNDRDKRYDREEDSANRSNGDSDNRSRDRNAEIEKRDKDSNRRDRDQRRDRDEGPNNRYNRDNYDRSHDRNSERERRDKAIDRSNRAKNDDKNNDSEEEINSRTKDKRSKRDERDNRSPEKRDDRGKYSNGTSKKDKHNNSSDEDDSRSRRKDKKQESTKSRDIERQSSKENQSKKDKRSINKDKKKNKYKDKKSKQESSDESDSSSDSSEESESETDDSEIENKKGGRYWDNFDIENRETVQEQTKTDKKSSKIKKSDSRRER